MSVALKQHNFDESVAGFFCKLAPLFWGDLKSCTQQKIRVEVVVKPCTQHNANLLLQFAAFFASHTWTQQKMGRGGFLEKFANPSNFFI